LSENKPPCMLIPKSITAYNRDYTIIPVIVFLNQLLSILELSFFLYFINMSLAVGLVAANFIYNSKTMDIESKKQKIKKLLALSKSPNENEAFSALEKAKQLMEEYGLNEQSCIYTSQKIKSTKTYNPWRTIIAHIIAWLYNCYKYQDKNDGTFVFNGEEFDVFMAGEMYTYLVKTIERMAKQNIRKNAKHNFRKSYKYGIASRLYDRIETLGKSCSWAPQRESKIKAITEFVQSQENIVSSKTVKTKINNLALGRGYRDADSISLNRQATGHGGRYLTV